MSELSVEQEFMIASTAIMLKALTKEQLEKEFIELLRVTLKKENSYKQFLLESAGIVTPIYDGKN